MTKRQIQTLATSILDSTSKEVMAALIAAKQNLADYISDIDPADLKNMDESDVEQDIMNVIDDTIKDVF